MMQDLFIIGATGNVGRTLLSQLEHSTVHRVVGVASSTQYHFDASGIDVESIKEFSEKKKPFDSYSSLTDLLDLHSDPLIYVDVTSEKDIADFHLAVIRRGNSMVTANKNPLSLSSYAVFEELTADRSRYAYSTTVMAGAEGVNFLTDLRNMNEQLLSVEGCFSGSLGFISSYLEESKPLSEVVLQARSEGYTEPDPRDDLNGLDVLRKLIILGRTLGYNVSQKDVALDPFIPSSYFKDESIDSFLSSLSGLDDEFEQRFKTAKEKGHTFRYIASLGEAGFKVSLREVPLTSSLGSLTGTANKLVLVTPTYTLDKPYSITAPGAGAAVTSLGIRRDLLRLPSR